MKQLPPNYRAGFDTALSNMFGNSKYTSDYLYYAHIIGKCKIIFEEFEGNHANSSIAVSFQKTHYVIHVNYSVFNSMSLEHRLADLKHECLHIIFNHISRLNERDHEKFNYATDCAINQLINSEHLSEGSVTPANFPAKPGTKIPLNLSGEHYYELVDDSCTDKQPQGSDHSEWENSEGDPDLQKNITASMVEKAMEETAKSRGNIPSYISDQLSLLKKKKELDWKQLLRRQVSNKKANTRKTLIRRDRRLPDANWIKGRTKDRISNPCIVGDESGSVSNEELVQAVGEALHICNTLHTDLWYIPVDTEAHTPHKLTSNQRTFNRTACGGTVLEPAIDKIKEAGISPTSIIVITDGGISESDVVAYKATGLPIIWLITSAGYIMDSMNSGKMKAFKLSQS